MISVTVTARGVAGFSNDPVEMELPLDSTVAIVLDLVLAAKQGPRHETDPKAFRNVIATVNGQYVPASQVEQRVLISGDEIRVMPLVMGG
ncbi:MAG: MoaD/ThiS family protein [Thermoleophilia bacterium]|nr:MoaD/ThiS family protein [Thermoleophilia bacterium]